MADFGRSVGETANQKKKFMDGVVKLQKFETPVCSLQKFKLKQCLHTKFKEWCIA
jgi:hypothetical protein